MPVTAPTTACSQCRQKEGDTTLKLKKCTRCKRVSYCNRDCQVKHWPRHKAECKKWQQEKNDGSGSADSGGGVRSGANANANANTNDNANVPTKKAKRKATEKARRLLLSIKHAKNPSFRGNGAGPGGVRQVATTAIALLEGCVAGDNTNSSGSAGKTVTKEERADASEAHFLLACAYYLGEDLMKAAVQMNQSVNLSESRGAEAAKRLHFQGGLLLKLSSLLGRYNPSKAKEVEKASETALRKAVEEDPGMVSSYIDLWSVLQGRNDMKAARRLGRLAVKNGLYWVNQWQRPAHMYHRKNHSNGACKVLASRAWWDPSHFQWHALLEKKAPRIKAELEKLLKKRAAWSPVGSEHARTDAALVENGEWKEVTLCGGGSSDRTSLANRGLCPETTAILENIPAAWNCSTEGGGECLFSSLKSGTRLKPHCGASNLRLTCHLGLSVPGDGWSVTCGGETRRWEEGKCLFFDDSFEHEVNHDGGKGGGNRIVLLLRFWHPDLRPEEWGIATKESMASYHDHCAASMEPPID